MTTTKDRRHEMGISNALKMVYKPLDNLPLDMKDLLKELDKKSG